MSAVPGRSAIGRGALSLVSMAGGVALAAIPAATLSISSHTFTTAEQGYVSLMSTASLFVGQLVAAGIVESRLGSPGTERRVAVPVWLSIASVLASVAVMAFFQSAIVLCIALPVFLSALEVGRSVGVAEHLDSREIWSAVLIGIGTVAGLAIAYLGGSWGFAPLAAAIAGATLVRAIGVPRPSSRPDASAAFWVVTDVGITGIVFPLLNALILAVLGAAGSVLFAAISTVSGLLAIPLNFMRLRLLKVHSRDDIVISVTTTFLCVAVIAILEFNGILGFVFTGPWTIAATVLPLAVACLWRAASIATTLPFAALRRAGHVRLLTILRGVCAAATFAVGAAVLPLNELTIVFVVLLLGELGQAATYEIARRRRGVPHEPKAVG